MDNWDYSIFWKETINQIKSEISEQEYLMWFNNIEYSKSNELEIVLSVPSSFYKDQVIQRYSQLIENKLLELSGTNINIAFEINNDIGKTNNPVKNKTLKDIKKPLKQNKKTKHSQLREEYVFENFVIGENNSFAANAAVAIAKNPGKAYNPCLIYGGVGLGKTHLIQAIGNKAYEEIENIKIVYITAETFTNEFIHAIRNQGTHKFKNKYRSVDILLIDDIHFLQGKNETQEELFHTFNALYDANKQMIFTCDRPVSELKQLTDRLRSRFERGLNVDLQPPNFETSIAILKQKVEEKKISISNEIIELIAKNITTNVRDLESALTKLIAYADLVNKEITVEIAQNLLKDVFTNPKQNNISIDLIQRVVSEYFGLSHNDLRGRKRTKAIAYPRQISMYIARELTEYSTTEVGRDFGGRDHTTVMHACHKIENGMKSDPTLETTISKIIRNIREYGRKS